MTGKRQDTAFQQRVDAEVESRVAVILDAMRINPNGNYLKQTPAQIRASAVASIKGHAQIEGKSEEWIEAHFDALLDLSRSVHDIVRSALMIRGRALPH